MKWNIDIALRALEPKVCPGTTITRVLASVDFLEAHGFKITELERGRESINVWCLAIGYSYAPKLMFYDRTIYGAFRKAKKRFTYVDPEIRAKWGL